jgi:hypothetical protein
MPGLDVSYTGTKDDVVDHLTEMRDEILARSTAPRVGQQVKTRLDGEIAGLDKAITVLNRWTGPVPG